MFPNHLNIILLNVPLKVTLSTWGWGWSNSAQKTLHSLTYRWLEGKIEFARWKKISRSCTSPISYILSTINPNNRVINIFTLKNLTSNIWWCIFCLVTKFVTWKCSNFDKHGTTNLQKKYLSEFLRSWSEFFGHQTALSWRVKNCRKVIYFSILMQFHLKVHLNINIDYKNKLSNL